MRLTFSILWFDDDAEYLDSLDVSDLESEIQQWGFVPKIVKVSSDTEFTQHSPFKQFDLIVVDYNLEGYRNGQDFIADIRSNQVFTEIVFYSAGEASRLWDAIREKQLEGVYVESRNSIKTKIIQVGHQIVHKVLDLENMRGIVIAEVGDLDLLLSAILGKGIEALTDDKKASFFKNFMQGIDKQTAKQQKALETFRSNPTIDAFLSLCDSSKRWQGLNRLIKQHPPLKGTATKQYDIEILFPRNCLGHGIPEPQEDGSLIFRHIDKEYPFNDDISRELRQKIVAYKIFLNEILSKL
jgi:CheY-like chemotaxis protein